MRDIREIFYSLEKISDKWDPYFDVYDTHLSHFRGRAPRVLEIGIQRGGSVDMWYEYFGKGTKVVAVDIDPACKQLNYDGDFAEVYIGDQADPEFWNMLLSEQDKFDIVIDDGGHTMRQQIVTIEKVFPHVVDGGVFICEDTHTSYHRDWGGQVNSPTTFLHYAKTLTDYLNIEHIPYGFISKRMQHIYGTKLQSISFYNSAVVFHKQEVKPFKRVFSNDRNSDQE